MVQRIAVSWQTVDLDTELREAIHGGRYLIVRYSVSGIILL